MRQSASILNPGAFLTQVVVADDVVADGLEFPCAALQTIQQVFTGTNVFLRLRLVQLSLPREFCCQQLFFLGLALSLGGDVPASCSKLSGSGRRRNR